MERAQKEKIIKDLAKKMVFLVGPRQVGKTWLARNIGHSFDDVVYLNYDRLEDQMIIRQEAWLESTKLLILDEIHKMRKWKNFLKGVFDTKPSHLAILVTGSARLDTFRQSGDSLAGRFFVHHLLPFTPQELREIGQNADLQRLESRGGFPEPFLAVDHQDADRWRMFYADSLIRNDVLDFESIMDARAIQLVFDLLRRRVGSPISYKSIAEDVQIAPNTVKKYISILESLYIVFRVTPFSKNIARSVIKEPKLYFYDTGLVSNANGAQLENLVAVSLLRHVLSFRDYKGVRTSLHYLRTRDKREVDFCVAHDDEIDFIAEVKRGSSEVSPALQYFHKKYNLKAFQIVQNLKRERMHNNIAIRKAQNFLSTLEI